MGLSSCCRVEALKSYGPNLGQGLMVLVMKAEFRALTFDFHISFPRHISPDIFPWPYFPGHISPDLFPWPYFPGQMSVHPQVKTFLYWSRPYSANW